MHAVYTCLNKGLLINTNFNAFESQTSIYIVINIFVETYVYIVRKVVKMTAIFSFEESKVVSVTVITKPSSICLGDIFLPVYVLTNIPVDIVWPYSPLLSQ